MTSAYAAEHSFGGSRAKLILSVFLCLGIGETTVGIVYVILLTAFKSAVEDDLYLLQWLWRLLFGIGLIPMACTLYFRLIMPESKPYQECELTRNRKMTTTDGRQMLQKIPVSLLATSEVYKNNLRISVNTLAAGNMPRFYSAHVLAGFCCMYYLPRKLTAANMF